MRASLSVALLTLLASCSGPSPKDGEAAGKAERVFCAIGNAKEFSGDCTVERSRSEGRDILVVRHPDGGFRRFELSRDNNGLITADGADEAGVAPNGALLDVRVGEDRYRFPIEEPKVDAADRATDAQ